MIPRILRRQGSQESSERGSQESSGSSKPLSRSHSCPVKIIYFDEIPFDERFETSLFVNFSETELSRLVPDPLFFEDLQFRFVSYHLDIHLQNSISSEQTFEESSNISVITEASPSLVTFPQAFQTPVTPSTPPSPPTRPSTPITPLYLPMANRYAPLQLPANPPSLPQDYSWLTG